MIKNIVLFTSIVTTYYLSFCSIVDVQSFFRISLPSNGVVSVNNAKLMGGGVALYLLKILV